MRPCASRTVNDAVHVEPGASAAQLAVTADADATENAMPTHAPVGRTSTTSSGVRGSGFTSPVAPTTSNVHDDPLACEQPLASVPPRGRSFGAAPTRSTSRDGATSAWLVTVITAASSAPGSARSAPVIVTMLPSRVTVKSAPE